MARTTDPRTVPGLLDAAGELFYARGVAATSMDEVAAASGLSKPTLYRHFPTKESLLFSCLDGRSEQLDVELRSWLGAVPPRRRPHAVVDWLCDWISEPDFHGCLFVRSRAELPGDEQVAEKGQARKRAMRRAIREACRAAGATHPGQLAEELALIVEGATTMAFMSDDKRSTVAAVRRLARAAFDAAGLGATR